MWSPSGNPDDATDEGERQLVLIPVRLRDGHLHVRRLCRLEVDVLAASGIRYVEPKLAGAHRAVRPAGTRTTAGSVTQSDAILYQDGFSCPLSCMPVNPAQEQS